MAKEKKSILFSLTGSIHPGIFSFFQTNNEVLNQILENKDKGFNNFLNPVLIKENGYVGTISNYYNKEEYDKNLADETKSAQNPNIGIQDTAYLNPENDILVLKGSVKFVNNFKTPSLTNSLEQKDLYKMFVSLYLKEFGLKILIKKYIDNIVSGKILWRNKYSVNKNVKIEAKTELFTKNYWLEIGNNFSEEDLNNLINDIDSSLTSDAGFIILNIHYFVDIGSGAAVYPSQLFLNNKEDNKGKYLSFQEIDGGKKQAILHSQKVGNAIRTIDTWYKNDDIVVPIPVEAYGVVFTQREAYRPIGSNSFYDFFQTTHFKNFIDNFTHQSDGDKHYLMSMFIKGGVFGGKYE